MLYYLCYSAMKLYVSNWQIIALLFKNKYAMNIIKHVVWDWVPGIIKHGDQGCDLVKTQILGTS